MNGPVRQKDSGRREQGTDGRKAKDEVNRKEGPRASGINRTEDLTCTAVAR